MAPDPPSKKDIIKKDPLVQEPPDIAREEVADRIRWPGGPGTQFCRTPSTTPEYSNCASDCGSNCHSDCGTNCHSDCGTNCSSDCGSNCSSDCDSNCASDCATDCDCSSIYGRDERVNLENVNERLNQLEQVLETRFGDIERILENINLNIRKK